MNKLSLFITLAILSLTANLSAQNSVTITPLTLKINAGETALFSVSVTAQSGFDASVFLTSTAARLRHD
ncbi:MAG: hypothetical protein U0264_05865 [Candidatus Kapaibacterium sp.]